MDAARAAADRFPAKYTQTHMQVYMHIHTQMKENGPFWAIFHLGHPHTTIRAAAYSKVAWTQSGACHMLINRMSKFSSHSQAQSRWQCVNICAVCIESKKLEKELLTMEVLET